MLESADSSTGPGQPRLTTAGRREPPIRSTPQPFPFPVPHVPPDFATPASRSCRPRLRLLVLALCCAFPLVVHATAAETAVPPVGVTGDALAESSATLDAARREVEQAAAGRTPAADWLAAGSEGIGSVPAAGPLADDALVPRLRATPALPGLRPPAGEPLPVFLTADRIDGEPATTVARGDVELRRLGLVVNADRMVYRPAEDVIEADGHLKVTQNEGVITGEQMRLRLSDLVGRMDRPTYAFRREALAAGGVRAGRGPGGQAHGQAAFIDFEGENLYSLDSATFSTCQPGDDSWYLRVSDLDLDYNAEVGNAYNAAVIFKGVPIFYSPWINFPLNNQRKSGFLPPTLGSTNISGTELTVPYYINIAPEMDATIAPRFFTKRGTQLNTEFRYLGERHGGQLRAEWLPDDKIRLVDRWGYSLQHTQTFGGALSGALNLNGVSDDFYYKDLSSRISNSAQTQLLRQGSLNYGRDGIFAGALVQTYQTLQPDPANPVSEAYELLPQLSLNARRQLARGVDGVLFSQLSQFRHPQAGRLEARRTVVYPQIAKTWQTPGWYLTPKFGVHYTDYAFDDAPATLERSYQRSAPITSVDSGLFFERDLFAFGRAFVQTLEPRLYYLHVPLRDQTMLTNNGVNFDSGIADFNFAQIFSENLFTGQDRLADANQLTAAVTTRFLEADSGGELLKVSLGQRFYFDSQTVTLNVGEARRTERKTDLLAAASGRLSARAYLDAALQYNPRDGRLERFNLSARYQPGIGRVVNFAYRFGRQQTAPFDIDIEQVDLSGQWPLFGGWQAVARYNYSLNENRVIETIGGLEYSAGCWSVRAVMQRYATTATEATSAMFLQLELTDFSRIGSNPLELLKRSIPGYGRIDQSASDPVFGSQQ